MYIIKNALRNIFRSVGRNVLIGIIVLVIACSACVALSIRESANKAREENMDLLDITAHINVDRQYIMNEINSSRIDMSNQEEMKEALSGISELSLDELLGYAESEHVKSFYYSATVTLNGENELLPIDTTGVSNSSDTTDSTSMPGPGGGPFGGSPGQPMTMMGTQGDFGVIGYSSDEAMEDFIEGTSSITEGTMFEEATSEYDCVVSDELATYNSLNVGDVISLSNPNNSEEIIELNVVGIYDNTDNSESSTGFSTSTDPANKILMSYTALSEIIDDSAENATTSGDDEYSNEIRSTLSGTYVFADIESYDAFDAELKTMGLGDKYVLTSNDVASYEASLLPLDNLKDFATTFLWVILIIGAIILVVINIFNIRERKYEVGVMTAIGMKKSKVALQFVIEIFVVTLIAIFLGTAIGAATSVPVTNSLLASQIEQQTSNEQQTEANFGRPAMPSPGGQGGPGQGGPSQGGSSGKMLKGGDVEGPVDYIDSVSYSVDINLVYQMMLIGILLTIVSSSIAILFIMRYEPLKILTNRD